MGDAALGVATRAVQREGQRRLLARIVSRGDVQEAVALGAEPQRPEAGGLIAGSMLAPLVARGVRLAFVMSAGLAPPPSASEWSRRSGRAPDSRSSWPGP